METEFGSRHENGRPQSKMKTPMMDRFDMTDRLRHIYLSATDKCYRTEHLLSLYLDGELTSQQVQGVEKHLEGCPSCKVALSLLKAAHNVLAFRPTVQPPAYLSERLRAAIAIEMSRPSPITQQPALFPTRLVVATASFAAIAVVTLIVLHGGPRMAGAKPPTTPPRVAKIPLGPRQVTSPVVIKPMVRRHLSQHTVQNLNLAEVPAAEQHNTYSTKPKALMPHEYNEIANPFIGHKVIVAQTGSSQRKSTHPTIQNAHTQSGPMIAAIPHQNPVASGINQTAPINNAASTQITQPSVQVADDVDHSSHVVLGKFLRSLALSTQSAYVAHVTVEQSAIRLAEAPGVQIVGSGIH
jgi:anti-sigma factor RsiW